MFCCPDCFEDGFLKRHIETFSDSKGKCSFCSGTDIVPVIDTKKLSDLFLPVIELYEVSEEGALLIDLLHEDWNIFSTLSTKSERQQLLSAIIDDDLLSQQRFKAPEKADNQYIKYWQNFSEELRHRNRFFPQTNIEKDQLVQLISYLELDTRLVPDKIYRARLDGEGSPYGIENMGKPPKDKAPDGRANPKGISYFYGASDILTAISETRPYKSEKIHVASFGLENNTQLIELRDPGKCISPFGHDDELSVIYTESIPFLTHLSEALSIPVLPDKKEFEYLPTQYLCELIKDNGFDGIVFKSSLGPGDNYVIFDDSILSGQLVEIYCNEDMILSPVKISP